MMKNSFKVGTTPVGFTPTAPYIAPKSVSECFTKKTEYSIQKKIKEEFVCFSKKSTTTFEFEVENNIEYNRETGGAYFNSLGAALAYLKSELLQQEYVDQNTDVKRIDRFTLFCHINDMTPLRLLDIVRKEVY